MKNIKLNTDAISTKLLEIWESQSALAQTLKVSRESVSKWLKGKEGGYKTIINKIHHHNSIQARRELS